MLTLSLCAAATADVPADAAAALAPLEAAVALPEAAAAPPAAAGEAAALRAERDALRRRLAEVERALSLAESRELSEKREMEKNEKNNKNKRDGAAAALEALRALRAALEAPFRGCDFEIKAIGGADLVREALGGALGLARESSACEAFLKGRRVAAEESARRLSREIEAYTAMGSMGSVVADLSRKRSAAIEEAEEDGRLAQIVGREAEEALSDLLRLRDAFRRAKQPLNYSIAPLEVAADAVAAGGDAVLERIEQAVAMVPKAAPQQNGVKSPPPGFSRRI